MEYSAVIFALILIVYGAESRGMIEVFKWKQLDFYTRGNNNINPIPMMNGNKKGHFHHPSPGGKIVFPDQLRSYNKREVKLTSRDDIPRTDQRFGVQNADINTQAMKNESYIAYNNVPMGVSHFNGRLFITIPRRRVGIPSTLNYIDLKKDGGNSSPKLRAYPDFETNQFNMQSPNPNSIVSVYRTTVDECQRLWFIDTGMLEYPDNRLQLQRPAIWVIDLKTNQVVHRFEIPESIAETGRGLASLTIDVVPFKCNEAFAYIPDLLYNRLYVYSARENRIWSFSHNYFNFDPVAGDLNIGGQSFRWDDGIFSITLGPRGAQGERNVYFHPMASNNEFMVSNKVLQNEANTANADQGDNFRLLGSRGTQKQSTMHSYDPRTGSIFYAEIQRNGVGCWNTKTPFNADNHDSVASDEQRMIYPSDLTIDEEGTMWVMTNSMPIFIYSTLDVNKYNFRIWKQNVFDAVADTKCAQRY